jgi:Flp pilus assembly protein TadB
VIEIALLVVGLMWLISLGWGFYQYLQEVRKVPLRLRTFEAEMKETEALNLSDSANLDEAWEREILRTKPPMFPTLQRWLSGKQWMNWLDREIQKAHISWEVSSIVAMTLLGMAFALAVGSILATLLAPASSPFGRLLFALLLAGSVPFGVFQWLRWCQRRFIRRVELILPDTLGLLANTLRAGMGFQQAIEIVAREGLSPLKEEFATVTRSLTLGSTIEEALEAMMERVPSPELQLALVAALVQREVGGSLAQIFETASATVRRRLQARRELQTETALPRLSAIALAFGLPLFMFVAINLLTYLQTREAWSAPMFTSEGRPFWFAIAVLELCGWVWLSQVLTRLSE